MSDRDDALEEAAREIETTSFQDFRGGMAKRKREREDAALRIETIKDCRRRFAAQLRGMKGSNRNDPAEILKRIQSAMPEHHVMHLKDAWPLAWKGLVNINAVIKTNSNSIPPETNYRIEITEDGLALIAASPASPICPDIYSVLKDAEYALSNAVKPDYVQGIEGITVWAEHWLPEARQALSLPAPPSSSAGE